ncbi:MAG: response regulator, partial [Chloroflexota bacterium]
MAETPGRPDDARAARAAPTILIVDDDRDVLRATERVLEEAGFHVLTGTRAAEAIELTYHHRPALLLLDVQLPDGDGIDVARQLKGDPALVDVFVALFSGTKTSSADQAKGLAEGLADGYMVRPLSSPELLARIDAFLRIRVTQRALRESADNFHAFFDAVADIIVVGTPDGRIIYANKAFKKLTGHDPSAVIGKDPRILQGPGT